MLEAIADFWKPAKKLPPKDKVKLENLQLGSGIGFGFVPQVTLSGRRFTVTAINTYKFESDLLTSFVLTQDKDAGASMIIAEAEGEPYLAISRRVSIADRIKLFDAEALDAIMDNPSLTTFACKEGVGDYKGWVASLYKREIRGTRGTIYKGDYRGKPSSVLNDGVDFSYTLLASENNEHALEIEKYDDGRIEVYATVYRRTSDIGEIFPPSVRQDMKLESSFEIKPALAPAATAPVLPASPIRPLTTPAKVEPKIEAAKPEPVKYEPPKFEIVKPQVETVKIPEPKPAEIKSDVKEEVATAPIKLPEFSAASVAKKEIEQPILKTVKAEEVAEPITSVFIKSTPQPYITQEIKAVNKDSNNTFVNESIDCELQVANKIIDEAIRSEMRINDVVRRVIGLPVSQQESVQIPVTLTEQDYALLAIRYGITATDRDAIKRRITEELGDFSGNNKQKKAA